MIPNKNFVRNLYERLEIKRLEIYNMVRCRNLTVSFSLLFEHFARISVSVVWINS